MPLFSVIMPVWERAYIVETAIKSVLNQTFDDYELIIINDGSTDSLYKNVKQYISKKIKYFEISHSGVSAARNYGIKKASGKYIAFLDSDNVWNTNFLKITYDNINKSNKNVAYCKVRIHSHKNNNCYAVGKKFNREELVQENYIDLNGFVCEKKCFDQSGLFDEKLKRLVDWDVILKITSLYTPIFIDNILVDNFKQINSITLTVGLQKSKKRVLDNFSNFFK